MEIRPVGADRQTMTRLLVAFRNYVNAPKRRLIPSLAFLPENLITAVN